MKKIMLLITFCLLWIGTFETFAQKNGEVEPIYYSEPYNIYTSNYKSSTASKPIRSIIQIENSDKKNYKEKKQKTKRPKTRDKNMLLGINVNAGFDRLNFEYRDYYKTKKYDYYWQEWYYENEVRTGTFTDYCYKMSFSLDFAYPVSKFFGLGFYLDNGFCSLKGLTNYELSVGLLTTFGNYHDGGAAFIFGIGFEGTDRFEYNSELKYKYGYDAADYVAGVNCFESLDIRLGVLFKNGLYITTDMSTDCSSDASFSMAFGIGYNFGALFKVR